MSWTDSGVGEDAVVKHVTSECANSTPTTLAPHAHFLVRTWLKPQGAALVLSTFCPQEDLISIRAMSSPSQSPPVAAHFAQHPALAHFLRGPRGGTTASQSAVWQSCHPESAHRMRSTNPETVDHHIRE